MKRDDELVAIAIELASEWSAPITDVAYPESPAEDQTPDDEHQPSDGWEPPDGYWRAEAPRTSGTVVLKVESREDVSGVVPGDRVLLQENGIPHSVGIVTQLSRREVVIRVIVEGIQPLSAEEST